MKRIVAFVVICTIPALMWGLWGITSALANVSRSFPVGTGESVGPGNLVSLDGKDGQVSLADLSNGQKLAGVVSKTDQSLVAITALSNTQQVQVVTDGTVAAYVSTIGGDIHAGDAVSISPLRGIGMEAGGTLRTIGIAQTDFNSATAGARTYEATDKSGNSKQVFIGSIPVIVSIGSGTAIVTQVGVVGQLQTVASAIIGHQVSNTQAVLSFLVVIIAISALIALVYGSIHGGIVAIGRNPLARASIYKSLLQVLAMAFMIALVAVVVLYLTLR